MAPSLHIKPKDPKQFVTPAPGAYNPDGADKDVKEAAPKYSFGIKTKVKIEFISLSYMGSSNQFRFSRNMKFFLLQVIHMFHLIKIHKYIQSQANLELVKRRNSKLVVRFSELLKLLEIKVYQCNVIIRKQLIESFSWFFPLANIRMASLKKYPLQMLTR